MFTMIFDTDSGKAMYHQLYEYIRNRITDGTIAGGEKLPSKRSLAAHLKISTVTVENAYEQLAAEGYVFSVPKSGFYAEYGIASTNPVNVCMKTENINTRKNNNYIYDFGTSGVDTDCFPFSVWAKLMRSVISDESEKLLQVVDSKGAYELREAIAEHLYNFRGIETSPENIIVGAGTEYLTSLIMMLLGHDRCYAVENPGYSRTHRLFERSADRIVAILQDENGLSVDELRKSSAEIVHTTPSHNFPLGGIMPVNRRKELLCWAGEDENRYIIEDEYDSEFRFTGLPIPSLYSLDTKGKVIYINTFTKTLAPSMRISYMVLPQPLMKRFSDELAFCSNTVSLFEQITLARFIKEGFFERHISRIKKVYRTRRNLLISALKENLPENSFEIEGEDSGLHFLMRVNCTVSEKELIDSAADAGVHIHGLSEYYRSGKIYCGKPCILFGYTRLPDDMIINAVECLTTAWKNLLV